MSKHTETPWLPHKTVSGVIVTADGAPICHVSGGRPEREENATLILTAPLMLAALVGAQSALRKALPHVELDRLEFPDQDDAAYVGEWLDHINEVLAKATGSTFASDKPVDEHGEEVAANA